jgi:hypothetical protein
MRFMQAATPQSYPGKEERRFFPPSDLTDSLPYSGRIVRSPLVWKFIAYTFF